jgi:hypothetical protein
MISLPDQEAETEPDGGYREFEGHAEAVQRQLRLQARMPYIWYLPANALQVNVGRKEDFCLKVVFSR